MTEIRSDPSVTRAYADAHSMHYKDKNLEEACRRYGLVIMESPDSREAQYSRAQIENIARSVVPAPAMLEALLLLIDEHLSHPTTR